MINSPAINQSQSSEFPDDVHALEDIILGAGNIASDMFERRNEFLIDQKSPGQFVSEADRKVEMHIRDEVARVFGDLPVVGEEYGGSFDGEGWVIDPIDGTSNFLCGIPLWSISVAYMSNHVPVLGAIYAPKTNMLVTAAAGKGLRYNRIAFKRRPDRTAVPTYSIGENTVWPRSDIRQTTDGLRQDGFEIVRLRSASQSLAMVGIGVLDGFIEEHLKLWDIAAGWLLCLEGGLPVKVTQQEGHVRSIWVGARS